MRQMSLPHCTSFILVADGAEELLVPTQRAEELRSDFVFRLEVIGKGVGIADVGDFKARFEKFRPQLEMMPGEGNVLRQDQLAIVADACDRQGE